MRSLLLVFALLAVACAYYFDDHISLNDVGRQELSDEAYNRYLAELSTRLFQNRVYPSRYDRYI